MMRIFNSAALATAALLLPCADGFTSPAVVYLAARPADAAAHATTPAGRTVQAPLMMMTSYAERLKEAQAAKAAAAAARGNNARPPLPSDPSTHAPASQTLPDSPFSAALQEELRVAITYLAARLQREKPMTRAEFERFETAVAIIVEDALALQNLPMQGAPAATSPEKPARRLVAARSPVPPPASGSSNTDDDFEVEGPQWDAKRVQYGLPMGVRNTYDIDDMEKMNPEEYQAALRDKVVRRAQSVRKTGSYGNIVSNEYLKFLGQNPTTGDEKFKANEKFVKGKGREDFSRY